MIYQPKRRSYNDAGVLDRILCSWRKPHIFPSNVQDDPLPARIRTIFIVALEVFITPDTEAGIACAEKKLAQLLELSVLC